MKLLLKIFTILLLSLSVFSGVNATSFFEKMIDSSKPTINIDDCNGECDDIQDGINIVKTTVDDIEKERTFSEYFQDILVYILGFISLIALVYIIYAGVMILTGAGDEEKLKKSKQTLLYVIIGIALIWLAFPITIFIIDALNIGGTPTNP